ncbi:hypothetical protein TrCOL_g11613, partial [Triparma columacea]
MAKGLSAQIEKAALENPQQIPAMAANEFTQFAMGHGTKVHEQNYDQVQVWENMVSSATTPPKKLIGIMKGVFTGIMGIKLVTDPKDALSADADELKPRDAAPILGRTAMLNSPALLTLRETISTYSGLNVDVQRELLSRAQGGQTVVELEPATRAAIVATNGDPNSPAHVFLSAPTGSGK